MILAWSPQKEERCMTGSSKAKMIIGIVIGAVGAVIALQNLQPVNTVVLVWRFTMPHVLLLAIMLGQVSSSVLRCL
jgi:uncharacterized integral membrane protein